MDSEIKNTNTIKLSKKEMLHLVEDKIAGSISDLVDGNKASGKLRKKIKKAGKLITTELRTFLKETSKKSQRGKKQNTEEMVQNANQSI